LFIGPVHGKRNPQIAYSSVFKEGAAFFQNLEALEDNSDNLNLPTELRKTRLKNIVKRPNRSGSKVSFPRDNCSINTLILDCMIVLLVYAGIRLESRTEGMRSFSWMAPGRCRNDRRV